MAIKRAIERLRSRASILETLSKHRPDRRQESKDLRALLAELEKYRLAVFLTAAERAYDEMAIRRAVSLELADLIIAEREKI